MPYQWLFLYAIDNKTDHSFEPRRTKFVVQNLYGIENTCTNEGSVFSRHIMYICVADTGTPHCNMRC